MSCGLRLQSKRHEETNCLALTPLLMLVFTGKGRAVKLLLLLQWGGCCCGLMARSDLSLHGGLRGLSGCSQSE